MSEAHASEEVIRQQAYDLWDRAGKPKGRSNEFWFAAKAVIEVDVNREELGVRREEFAARRAEAAQKLAEAAKPWWRGATPLAVAIATGALALLGNIGVALYGGQNSLEQLRRQASNAQGLEEKRIEATRKVEDKKNEAALIVEKEKNKAALILQAVSTSDPATARRNVLFFVDSGFFSGQEQQVRDALDKYLPVLPSSTGSTSPLPASGMDYEKDFWLAKVRQSETPYIDKAIDGIIASRDRIDAVAKQTSAPWYIIAAVWERETSGSFVVHLHNGDPLKDRTVHLPAGRPPIWPPPGGQDPWTYSAVDAIEFYHLDHTDGLPLGDQLQRVERLNGLGYFARGVFTPYLWGGTDFYAKGAYLADALFDPNAISRQIGIVALLRRMNERGIIALRPSTSAAKVAPEP